MTKIIINNGNPDKEIKPAGEMPEGCLFTDLDDELYLKVPDGAIRIHEGDEGFLVPFTDEEIANYGCFPNFKQCELEDREVTITITCL